MRVVRTHDPVVHSLPEALAGREVDLELDLRASLDGADAAVLVTRWHQYERLPEIVATLGRPILVVDGRRMLTADSVPHYDGVGR